MERSGQFKPIPEQQFLEVMRTEAEPYLAKFRETGTLNVDGAEIYYETYVHPEERAAVVVSHGFCEYCGKMAEVIYYFLKEGYSVFMPEHRGHGRSTRLVDDFSKIYIESYYDYVKDFHRFVKEVVQKKSQTGKLVLYAHSMGGAIGALVMERHPKMFRCAILSSPMMELDIGRFSNRAAWLLYTLASINRHTHRFAPGEKGFKEQPDFERSCAMSQPRYMRVHEERKADARLQTSGATYAWLAASLKAIGILQRDACRVVTPVLLFQAENDKLVKPGGQELFAQNSQNTELVKIMGSKHEIYNATDEIIADYYTRIFDFIGQQLK